MLRVLLARDLASHKKVGDLLRVRRGAKALALVDAECLDPAPDVARVRLAIMWHSELAECMALASSARSSSLALVSSPKRPKRRSIRLSCPVLWPCSCSAVP